MYVIKNENMKVPLKIWANKGSIEPQCEEQMIKVASLPFLHKHIALMPDGHLGFGASIGSVIATKNVVIPSLVGVDIGCGMCAVKTSLKEISTKNLKAIMSEIRKVVPLGFKKHNEMQEDMVIDGVGSCPIVQKNLVNASKSLGTLGGGNHFIEIQRGSDGHIWVMIHSGSRNLGKQVCDHYKKLAYDLNHKWFSDIPEADYNNYLGFLPLDTDEARLYRNEMRFCVKFALRNRELMMDRVMDIVGAVTLTSKHEIREEPMINIAHNYATMEHHYGKNVLVHRKGATSAKKGEIGIIPGSQGSKSYIVEGLGNKESFTSCSHGAGRIMGRKFAIKNLDLEKEKEISAQHIVDKSIKVSGGDKIKKSISTYCAN